MSTETLTPEQVIAEAETVLARATHPGWMPSITQAVKPWSDLLADAIGDYRCVEDGSIHYSAYWDDLRNERDWPEPETEALRRAAGIAGQRAAELTDRFPVLKTSSNERGMAA